MVADLGLAAAGVDFSAAGIPITDRGATNVPGVWACGDVTGQHMLAHVATREGIVAVNNMFGHPDRIRYAAIPSVIYTHPEVSSAGRTERELTEAGIDYQRTVVPMGVAGRFLIENDAGHGFLKLLTGTRYGEILGVHAVADLSSEFIVTASALIETELSVRHAAQIVFPHPTVSEALREAIRCADQGRSSHDQRAADQAGECAVPGADPSQRHPRQCLPAHHQRGAAPVFAPGPGGHLA